MNIMEIRKAIIEDGNDLYFEYNGLECGVSSTVINSVFTFCLWYGTFNREFSEFDKLVHEKCFDGKAIADLIEDLDIYLC